MKANTIYIGWINLKIGNAVQCKQMETQKEIQMICTYLVDRYWLGKVLRGAMDVAAAAVTNRKKLNILEYNNSMIIGM